MATLPDPGGPTGEKVKFSPRSSFLELCEYDRKSNTLDVTFKSGSVHRYLFCFPATFDAFRQSPDHSSFYARAIKGKLMAVPIIKHTIGRNRSTPLRGAHQRTKLNGPVAGTVKRAGL
jgi:hypothetical protein